MQAVAFPLEIDNSAPPPEGGAAHLEPESPAPATPHETAPPSERLPITWTGALLAHDAVFSARREAKRFGIGLGLAAIYGLALGAREGRASFLTHAVGVPAALLVAFGVGIPALYIFLAMLDAPVAPTAMASAASRAGAVSGLVLAGLAPAAALFVVSADHRGAAALAAAAGLAVGGAFGLGHVVSDLRKSVSASGWTVRVLSDVVFGVFGLFAVIVTLRVWLSLLPLIGGGR